MSRRTVAILTFLLAAAVVSPVSAQTPDLIYHNAKVVTVNAAFEIAQAVAIAGGTIVGVGSNEQMKALAGPRTTLVDLGGKPLLPGFYDNHIHLGGPLQPWKYGGMISAVPDWLRGADNVETLMAALKAKAAQTPKGEWITGELAREEWPNSELPTRWHFDKVTPDHPVALARGPHTLLVNSNALALAGVTRDTKPPGGEIVHDAKGEPTGKILEAARRVITRVMPATSREGGPDAQLQEWRTLLGQLVSLGVTSVNVAGVRPDVLPQVKRLYEQHGADLPRMTVQLRVSPGFDSHDDPEVGARESIAEIEAIGDPRKYFTVDKLKLGAVKMSIDGGLSAPIFWSLKPYENRPGFFGEQRIPDSAFARVARRAHALGWQLGIHVMGDAATVMVVNELEKMLQASPRANHRHYLHHVSVLPPEDTVRTMARLPIMVASQPGFLLGLGSFADEALEPEREATQQPSRSLLKHGVRVSYGSDAGPYGPIAGLYAAVTRRGWNGVVHGPDEGVTVEEAIRMHTFEPAYFTFDESRQGSIEVGKAADFVVLDTDLLTVDPERIQHVQVLRTMIAGREIYNRQALPGAPRLEGDVTGRRVR
jgi:predicted amidohydrolase YtcJ